MNDRAVRVAWYRFRAGRGRRWTDYVGTTVVVALIGGVSLAAVAGARRTETSFPTYVASTSPSTIGIFSRYLDPQLGMTTGYSGPQVAAIARQPLIEQTASAVVFDANIDLAHIKGAHNHIEAGESPPAFLGSLDGYFATMDRVTLVSGRLADASRPGEAVMDAQAAREMGLHIGSVIRIPFYTDVQTLSTKSSKPFLVAPVKMVGEFVASQSVIESDIDALKSAVVIFSPALTRKLATRAATGTETFMRLRGGTRNAKRVLAEVYRVDPVAAHFPNQITSQFVPVAQSTIAPDALALAVFGGIAGLALLVVAGLVIGRITRGGTAETEALRALGADRSMMVVDHLLGVLTGLVVGAVLSVVVAVSLSPLAPLGPVRSVYPARGVAYDWTVLGFGVAAMLVALALLAVLLARREVRGVTMGRDSKRRVSEPPWGHAVASSGLPISVVAGVRFALESGKGRNAAPVRSALFGAALAVTVLVSTVTFGASLNSLVSNPPRYGWNWDYALLAGFAGAEDLPGPQVARFMAHDPDVAAWSGISWVDAKLDGQRVGFVVEKPGAAVAPPVLSGHGLRAANQIVLGAVTLAALHKRVGDTVTLDNGFSKPRSLLIVGTTTLPALGGGNNGMGRGAWAATSDFPEKLLNEQSAPIPGPNAVIVRIRPGVSRAAAYRSLEKVNAEINTVPQAQGAGGGVTGALRPVQIVNFHSMGTTPTVFAAGLALGALVALGLTVSASVRRRRRDLALLKALGLTRRQVAAAISWQATVAALVGVVVGLPVGIVIGRQLWIAFAHSIDAVPVPAVPVLSMVAVAVGALLFANLVAALPGRSAARIPVALVLRAE